ncbi:protein-glutamate O-methyltransferase CheR [Deltaproteobacteria bacterium TL4]
MRPITDQEFQKFRELIISLCGIVISDDRKYFIETRLMELGQELGVQTLDELRRKLKISALSKWPRVIDLITTDETQWFRDDSCWNTLEKKIFPQLFHYLDQGVPEIHIWSAGCSTGQESYSLAILLDELRKKHSRRFYFERFFILATDISVTALSTAQSGVYDTFNMKRGLSPHRKKLYFTQDGNQWKINDAIQKRVTFRQLNLIEHAEHPQDFHLILCRNVAIYFAPNTRQALFSQISEHLPKEGVLILGSTESLLGYSEGFQSQEFENATYYQKK